MRTCPECQHENPDDAMKCGGCGRRLWDEDTVEATMIQKLPEGFQKQAIKSGWGTSTFEPSHQVIIHVRDTQEPIFVRPTSGDFVLGRVDDAYSLNLTPYGALEKGVSRTHAALRQGDEMIFIVDLGSTNGTFLNEQQLAPHQPRVLRSGDQVRLGQLVLHIYFSGT